MGQDGGGDSPGPASRKTPRAKREKAIKGRSVSNTCSVCGTKWKSSRTADTCSARCRKRKNRKLSEAEA